VKAVFVDSSVWIAHFRGVVAPVTRALDALLAGLAEDTGRDEPARVVVGDLVLHEVLRGIPDDREHDEARRALLAFDAASVGGVEIALAAAGHYRALRRRGITVRKTVDCLIAAWCIANKVPLLHDDRDFLPFAEHCGLALHPT
jgi:predicted nucleic acid-binding protein